ncbi:hypothetical protein T06_9213 [Trichinella sp. T6]|nr:hypothetical protein T06_9213 [Trichinella sp. T6]
MALVVSTLIGQLKNRVGWNRSRTPTTVSLATTNYIDCLPCTAAAVTGQIVNVCFARIQKEQMFRLLSMSPAADLLAASRFVYWSIVDDGRRWSISLLADLQVASSVNLGICPPVGRSVGRLTKPEYTGKQVEKLFLSSDEAVFIQLICSKPSYQHASCSLSVLIFYSRIKARGECQAWDGSCIRRTLSNTTTNNIVTFPYLWNMFRTNHITTTKLPTGILPGI